MSLVGLVDDIWSEVVLSSGKTLGEMVVRKECLQFWWSIWRIKPKILTFWVEGCCYGWQWLR